MTGINIFLLVNYYVMNILQDKYFKTVFDWLSFTGHFAQLLLEHCNFLNIDIPQGNVATYLGLRRGAVFKYEFVANLPLSLSAKEFRKSANIWGSYGQEFSVLFFDSRRMCTLTEDAAEPDDQKV